MSWSDYDGWGRGEAFRMVSTTRAIRRPADLPLDRDTVDPRQSISLVVPSWWRRLLARRHGVRYVKTTTWRAEVTLRPED